jgi:hypothetical protein
MKQLCGWEMWIMPSTVSGMLKAKDTEFEIK